MREIPPLVTFLFEWLIPGIAILAGVLAVMMLLALILRGPRL